MTRQARIGLFAVSAAGLAALMLWGASGLPTGIQLIGRPGRDAPLMAAALFAKRALAEAG